MASEFESEDKKPPYGNPCNHCGECCRTSVCVLGRAYLYKDYSAFRLGPCRAWEGRCGLIDNPGTYAPLRTAAYGQAAMSKAAKHLIGAGLGCLYLRVNEKPDPLVQEKIAAFAREPKNNRLLKKARQLWGV